MDENLAAKIRTMTPEQKASMAQIIQTELASRQAGGTTDMTSMTTSTRPRGFLPTATSTMENLPNALSIAIRGKPIKEDDMTEKINTLIATEKLKEYMASQTPEGRLKRREAEVALGGGGVPIVGEKTTAPISDITPVAGKDQTYIKVPKGPNKYGVMEYEYKSSPESEASAAAMKTEATKGAEQKAAMKPALNIIRTLKQDWQKAFPDAPVVGEGLKRFEYGAGKTWDAFTQENPEAAAYLNTRKAYLSLLVRGLGEKGVLTNPDIERVATSIGTQWDTKTVAIDQFNRLEKLLSADMQNYIDNGGDPAIIQEVANSINMQSGPMNNGDNQTVGKIIKAPDGKRYRVIGGDPNDPDVEEI